MTPHLARYGLSPAFTHDLAVFGGSFDPPHRGHLALISHALQTFPRAPQLLLLPAGTPYQKNGVSPASERLAMLHLLLQELPPALRARVTVDEREIRALRPSRTVETLRALRAERGANTRLWWLMGADQWHNLPTWYAWRTLFNLAHIIIVPRTVEATLVEPRPAATSSTARSGSGATQTTSTSPATTQNSTPPTDTAKLLARIETRRARLDPDSATHGGVYRLHGFAHPASSTALRTTLAWPGAPANLPSPQRDWLTPALLDYIARAHPYAHEAR